MPVDEITSKYMCRESSPYILLEFHRFFATRSFSYDYIVGLKAQIKILLNDEN